MSDGRAAAAMRVWRPSRRGAPATRGAVQHGSLPIRAAVNVGAGLGAALTRIGIDDLDTLRRLGATEAWRRIRCTDPAHASEVSLYALEGAIRGVRWTALDGGVRGTLRRRAGQDAGDPKR